MFRRTDDECMARNAMRDTTRSPAPWTSSTTAIPTDGKCALALGENRACDPSLAITHARPEWCDVPTRDRERS